MNTEKLEKLKKSLDNKFIPDNMKDKIRAEIKKLEADIKTDETITATEVKEEVKEIEKKVEKALEVAEEKEEQAEAKAEEKKEKAPRKAREKKATQSETKTPKVEPKSTAKKKSVFSIAKEIRKDNESWEDAKERARKMMKSETTETKKKTRTETDKLLAMVRRNKEYKKLAGTSNLPKDASRRALPRGKRVSADGNVYYENRANRVDVGGFKNAYLAKGGEIEMENSNLYFVGRGRDVNGNKVIKISFPNQKPFSIQTLGNLPKTHRILREYDNDKDITPEEIATIEREVISYVEEFGSKKQKESLRKYEGGGGVDGIIELKPLELIPLSTQLNRLSGYNWTSGDWESEDGGKPSTMPNSVIVNVHTKQKFRLSPIKIEEKYPSNSNKPLYAKQQYRIVKYSEDGQIIEYSFGWHDTREDAVQELKEMFGYYADKGVYVETLDEEIDLTDDGKVRARKTQEGKNLSYGELREKHGASPEALAFDNGGRVGRYSILGEVDGEQPILYATTDDKERIKPLVNMAEIDLYELTGKNHRIFVTDEVTDDEVYHYGNGGRTRERRYVNHSQDYEVRYSKNKPHRRGYGYAGGGVVLDNVKIEVYKSFHGLKAENYFDDVNGYDWNVVTMKRHTGELVSSARGGKANKSEGNVEFFTFDYNSPNIKLISSRPSRVTEKVIEIQHSQALQLFKEKMEEGNFADGGTIIGTPETPLARGLDIDYTGLVGETGAMSSGEMFAEGGSLGNHGLKQGDEIIKTMSGGVQKVKTKSGDIVYVNLANGYRGVTPPLPFAKGGYTNERRHVNKAQDYEVRYAKQRPNRTGYSGKRSFDNGGEISSKQLDLGYQYSFEKDEDNVGSLYKEAGVYSVIGFENGKHFSESFEKFTDAKKFYLDKKGKVKFDNGGISNGRYEVVKVIGFDKNGKTLPKNEIKVIADFDSRKEALNFVYEQQFKKDVTQRDIFIRDTKTNKTFAEGGFMTDPNFGDFQSGVYAEKGAKLDNQFSYMMLSRLQMDCDYYLGYGNRSEKVLWAGNVDDHIAEMKKLWNSLPKNEKPEWLTMKDILDYEKKMKSDNYATGGVTKNYINRNQLNTITIKKGDKKLTYKVSDVYNGAYKLEDGGNLERTAFYVSKRNVVKVQLKDGKDVKVANGYWIKKGAKPIHTSKYDDRGEMKYEGGGKTTFKEKATAIAKNFEGKKVEPKYQKEYGKTYDKAEAKEVGNKIAGSQKAKYDSKMSGGGKTKRGGAMQLAKQIRKDGESWQSALKRANEQMRKK